MVVHACNNHNKGAVVQWGRVPSIIRGKRFNRASDYQANPTVLVTHDLILIKGNKVMKFMFIVT